MKNLLNCIKAMGIYSGVRYWLGIAQEGIDFITPGYED